MAFSGDSQAMDKQPGQRQCDGQQQPGPQPGRQKNPHAERPFSFFFFFFFFSPPGARSLASRRLIGGTSYRIELCISGVAASQVGAQPGRSHLSSRRYPQRGALITTPERLVLARCRG